MTWRSEHKNWTSSAARDWGPLGNFTHVTILTRLFVYVCVCTSISIYIYFILSVSASGDKPATEERTF